MKKLITRALLLIALLPASACALQPEVQALVDAARAEVKMVPMARLVEAREGEGVLVVDIREPNELELDGRVEGAINIPRGMLEFNIWPFVERQGGGHDKSRPIYIYCKSGSRSALGAQTLQRLGFENVHAVDMRFQDWLEAELPTEGGF